MRRPRAAGYGLLLGTVLVWGATFSLVKLALRDVSPLLFNLLRFALATVTLAVVNRSQLRSINRRHVQGGVLAGFFLALGYQLQTLGLVQTEAAKSAFLTGLVVIFVPALTLVPAFRFQGTARPGMSAATGAGFAFYGLIRLTTPAGVDLHHLFSSMGKGDLLTLVGALAFAAHVLALSRVARDLEAGPLATIQIGSATFLLLGMLPLEQVRVTFTPRLILTLCVCSLLATAAAFTIQSFSQRVLPPTHIILILTLEPVFAWLTSAAVFHGGLDGRSLSGGLLILTGIASVEWFGKTGGLEIPA